jgi:hypothetical protein
VHLVGDLWERVCGRQFEVANPSLQPDLLQPDFLQADFALRMIFTRNAL